MKFGYGRYINISNQSQLKSIYEGYWQDDKYHGYGTEKWPSGDNYEGLY